MRTVLSKFMRATKFFLLEQGGGRFFIWLSIFLFPVPFIFVKTFPFLQQHVNISFLAGLTMWLEEYWLGPSFAISFVSGVFGVLCLYVASKRVKFHGQGAD